MKTGSSLLPVFLPYLVYYIMKRICVYCGSSNGFDEAYALRAEELGKALVGQNIELVYGGTDVGLMGKVANAVLKENGKATGVIPQFIKDFKLAHDSLSELIIVETMHERKAVMSDLSDGFIALPGGFGTLEELFEMLTASQLGLHKKPIALLNINNFYDDLVLMLKRMVEKGFLQAINLDMLIVSDNIEEILVKMRNYQVKEVKKWVIN